MAKRTGTFNGANVFLSRSLVPPEMYDALHDALRLNGAEVFLCSDPSRASPNDYHVISSPDHEKFEDLKAKGCNLLGPHCILSCAKECRVFPKQGYTCCLAMDGVKVLASGFEKDEKVKIEQLVTAMGGVLQTKASLDISFVIAKNVLAAKYKWALNILKKPIVNMMWLYQCWTEHRLVPQEPFRVLPFSGLTICVTRIPADERKEMESLIVQNGGQYSADLTKKCTHLVSDAPEGDKYVVARRWGHIHIVTRRWVDQSIARRACLEEGHYHVNGASVSRKNVKIGMKELRSQDQSNSASQSLSSVAPDLETAQSQNISDATAISNSGSEAPCIADDSEDENSDLYLSGCRILLLGFDEKELRKLVNMIRKGGGTRHMLLNEKLTHLIVGAPSDNERKEVRRLAVWGVINVVKSLWLEECDRARKELPVSQRHTFSDVLLSKDSICPNNVASAGISDIKKGKNMTSIPHVSTGQPLTDMTCEEGLALDKKRGEETPGVVLKGSVISDLAPKQQSIIDAVNNEAKLNRNLQCNYMGMDSQNSGALDIFKGRSFCFSRFFPIERRTEIVEWVRQGGGLMVDDHQNVHFIIGSHGFVVNPSDVLQSTIVSSHWIRSCLEERCMQDVGSHILYSPLHCHVPLPGFESLRFCVSQYEEKERHLLRNLCYTLGAKSTEKLSRKVTHLLCKFTSGPKYEAACKWGIQSVTADWITECVRQDMIVSLDPFRPNVVTVQDREAGLCTMSQYPTQAARMIVGDVPSQFLSGSQVSLNTSTLKMGVKTAVCFGEPENSKTFGKRSRFSEDANFDNPSPKARILEAIGVSTTVPDVAAAIEDLLAQSNKSVKSPGRNDCDRSSLSPNHSILGQDHAISHSSYNLSGDWLNRTEKQSNLHNPSGHDVNPGNGDGFSETQTESQVVGYEEDLSGRQKIIDRVRSQSIALTPETK